VHQIAIHGGSRDRLAETIRTFAAAVIR
jgi:hypothetical protein